MKKQMDEMERNIKLQSQSIGFKSALLLLALWTIYENAIAYIEKQSSSIIPALYWLSPAYFNTFTNR